ncbi:unnamed protein product, partial [Orchesella dallaii]
KITDTTHIKGGLLDHIYVNSKENFAVSGQFALGGSDHKLCFTIRKKEKIKFPPKTIVTRNYKNVQWKEVSKEVAIINGQLASEIEDDNLYLTRKVDQEFTFANDKIMKVIDTHAPARKRIVNGIIKPWYTSEMNELGILRDRAENTAMKTLIAEDDKKTGSLEIG